MKVVILCGGFGTRIRDISAEWPKPMVRVGDKPILWHVMKTYASHGFNDFVLCLGYRAQVIKDYFLNYRAHTSDFTLSLAPNTPIEFHSTHGEEDWTITFADTGQNTMTGARVARVAKFVGDETFMLTYGDGVGDVDLGALARFHASHDKLVTVTGVRPPGRYGEISTDDAGDTVVGFNEKPQATEGWISGGFFVCDSGVFDYLNEREDLVLEQGPLQALAAANQLMLYKHPGFWQCMDTNRDHRLLERLIAEGTAPWMTWT